MERPGRGFSTAAGSIRAAWAAVPPWVRYAGCAAAGALLAWLLIVPGSPAPVRRSDAAAATSAARPRNLPADPVTAPANEYVWSEHPEPVFPVPGYAQFLKGVRILIDPGHGGRAERVNWKVGPTGLREEQVNLRVSLFLREFLDAAGADVRMTRTGDVYLAKEDDDDLRLRAEMANDWPADLLLSVHHNWVQRPEVNYTTVYYHGLIENNPASVTAARHVLMGLNDALRLDRHVGLALRSDFTIYPKVGFGLLRQTRTPAVLSEASFYSNPQEEERLRDPLYNRREAYGLFLGLARWAQAGLPRVALAEPDSQPATFGRFYGNGDSRRDGRGADRDGERSTVLVRLDDGLAGREGSGGDFPRIFSSSIKVLADDRPAPFEYDAKTQTVRVTLPGGRSEPVELMVDFQNIFGQTVLHPRLRVE